MDTFLIINSWLIALLIGASWFLIIAIPFFVGAAIFLAVPPCCALLVSNQISIKSEKKVKVLMVDDQPTSLIVLEHLFKGLNCEYKIAKSGWDAIKAMKNEMFDLVIMDYEMPHIDGPETIMLAETYKSKIKGTTHLDQYQKVPLIGFTANRKQEWDLPSLNRFQLKLCLYKQSSYSDIRNQIFHLLPQFKEAC